MTHQFAIGDYVQPNGTSECVKVIGFSPKDRSLLLVEGAFKGAVYMPAQSVTLVRSASEAQVNHPSKNRNMTHQFAIGDTVKLNGTYHTGKIIEIHSQDKDLFLCDWNDGDGRTYASAKSLTLVRPAGAAQVNHPRKIET